MQMRPSGRGRQRKGFPQRRVSGAPSGWVLAGFGGLALGWIKAMPNRMNNYLPMERRIRKQGSG